MEMLSVGSTHFHVVVLGSFLPTAKIIEMYISLRKKYRAAVLFFQENVKKSPSGVTTSLGVKVINSLLNRRTSVF